MPYRCFNPSLRENRQTATTPERLGLSTQAAERSKSAQGVRADEQPCFHHSHLALSRVSGLLGASVVWCVPDPGPEPRTDPGQTRTGWLHNMSLDRKMLLQSFRASLARESPGVEAGRAVVRRAWPCKKKQPAKVCSFADIILMSLPSGPLPLHPIHRLAGRMLQILSTKELDDRRWRGPVAIGLGLGRGRGVRCGCGNATK
ncbi:hypothetical protein F5144DRAFT_226786 [Chaetomium tenue]|uniref:Uncharacterized protein n=1 Tax=Chaetomium tenue TaxID=1854479 RepID=A0ACB7PAR7_9PEZI|nr:hypothetical protein F5144DRAFT_226786 [Chaetomium globosum]